VFDAVQSLFPNARGPGSIVASDAFDDFVADVWDSRNTLPVLDNREIGDSWIYGANSDPVKVRPGLTAITLHIVCFSSSCRFKNDGRVISNHVFALINKPQKQTKKQKNKKMRFFKNKTNFFQAILNVHATASALIVQVALFRSAARQRAACLADPASPCAVECATEFPAQVQAFERLLMKVGEHTWGHNGGDDRTMAGGWGNAALAELRADGASRAGAFTRQLERAWTEQRSFVANASRASPSVRVHAAAEHRAGVRGACRAQDVRHRGVHQADGHPCQHKHRGGERRLGSALSHLYSPISTLYPLISVLYSPISTLYSTRFSTRYSLHPTIYFLSPSLPLSLSLSLSISLCVCARARACDS
jgi:hypothetical protein